MKKALSITGSIVALFVSILLVISFVLPFVTANSESADLGAEYYGGRYTSQIAYVSEYDLGFSYFINVISYEKDSSLITMVQSRDSQIADLRDQITRYAEQGDGYEEEISTLREQISDLNDEINQIIEDYGGDEAIADLRERLLEDKTLAKTIANNYYLTSIMEGAGPFKDELNSPSAVSSVAATRGIVAIVMLIIGYVAAGIGLIVAFIRAIIVLIKLLKNVTHLGDVDIYASISKNCMPVFVAILLMAALYLCVSLGSGATIGSGLILAIVLIIVNSVLRAATAILAEEDSKVRVGAIIKNGITLVAVVALIVSVAASLKVNVLDNYIETMPEAQSEYTVILMEQYVEQINEGNYENISEYLSAVSEARENARSDAYEQMKSQTGMAFAKAYITPFFVLILAICIAFRLAQHTMKSDKENLPYTNVIVLAAILVVCTILPAFGTVNNDEKRKESYDNGEFVILYDAYKYDGTAENSEYLLAKDELELMNELYDEAKEAYDSAEDKEAMLPSLNAASDAVDSAAARLELLETNEKSSVTLAIVFAVILLAAEIAYVATPKSSYSMGLTTTKRFSTPKAEEEATVTEAPQDEE